MIYETNYIMHYNPNHDKLGRFAKGTSSGFYSKSTAKKLNKIDKMAQKKMTNRLDKKIARKLVKLEDPIYDDLRKKSLDFTESRLSEIIPDDITIADFPDTINKLETFKSDTIQMKKDAIQTFNTSLARIGERNIGDGFTSQQLGPKTWKEIDDIISSMSANYDVDISETDDLINMMKNALKSVNNDKKDFIRR